MNLPSTEHIKNKARKKIRRNYILKKKETKKDHTKQVLYLFIERET